MSKGIILKNAKVFISSELEEVDLFIKGNKIVSKVDCDGDDIEVVDLKGLTVLPGLIDTQVHFRDPGLTHKEDIKSGSLSALAGGITGYFEMPNTVPATTSAEALKSKLDTARNSSWTNYAFFMGASAENADSIDKLEQEAGCSGVKIFMGSSTGSLLVHQEEILDKILSKVKRRFSVHSESEALLLKRQKLIFNKGMDLEYDVKLHPKWRNVDVAMESTRQIMALAKKHKAKLHLLHVSTKDEMEYLKSHKTPEMSVEVTPQHLTLASPECYEAFGTYAQMNPPIRTKEHREGLWKAINTGIVDIIGSDHAPHTEEEKKRPYPKSPSGIPGVQTTLPLLLHHMAEGRISLNKIVELMCLNPSKLFNIQGQGEIKIGREANLTILDLEKEEVIKKSWLTSRVGWSPFEGLKIKGFPVMTMVQGRIAYNNGEIIGEPAGEAYSF